MGFAASYSRKFQKGALTNPDPDTPRSNRALSRSPFRSPASSAPIRQVLAGTGRLRFMVFQSYALYPHMNLFDNMASGLKLAKKTKDFISDTVNNTSQALGLDYI